MKTMSRPPARGLACLVLALCAGLPATAAWAQWAWRDSAGKITYSDAPPPADVQQTNILRQPSAPVVPDNQGGAAAPANGAPAERRAAPAPKPLAEQEADFRKRVAERHKSEQKQEEAQSQAADRSARCEQAKGYLKLMEGGTRLFRPDAEGNRNYLDDSQREEQTKRLQGEVAENCQASSE